MLPVGDKLRTLRNERNLSQDRLAKKVSVTRASIATYESGNRLPSLYVLVRLARALGVTTDYLLGVSSDKTSFLDVSGLTTKKIVSLDLIIDNYRASSTRRMGQAQRTAFLMIRWTCSFWKPLLVSWPGWK